MSITIMVHDMTSARAELIDPGDGEPPWAAFQLFDEDRTVGAAATIVVRTSEQADWLIKAGFAALGLLTAGEDGAA